MPRQEANPLAVGPLQSNAFGDRALAAFAPGRGLTNDERRAFAEADLERAVIAAFREVGNAAIVAINDLHAHGAAEFVRTSGEILALKAQVQGPEQQVYVDAFMRQLIPRLAQHDIGIVEVAAHAIGQEIHRDKHPEPERPVGLLERLLGRA